MSNRTVLTETSILTALIYKIYIFSVTNSTINNYITKIYIILKYQLYSNPPGNN